MPSYLVWLLPGLVVRITDAFWLTPDLIGLAFQIQLAVRRC